MTHLCNTGIPHPCEFVFHSAADEQFQPPTPSKGNGFPWNQGK